MTLETDATEFSIVFHTIEDFNKALEISKTLVPDNIDVDGIEMIWNSEWYRNHAIHELDNIGIEVDTYEM
jgi:hypothetical protein